jgi:phosphopantothenoylcysteine decarboxylase/phosphopantothenate--cysteine ligase
MDLKNKTILLIISGGIAAYKSLELIRLIKKQGGQARCILTKGGAQFVTPLSVSALSGEKCYSNLWDLTDEAEMGHIRLAREPDLILVAPASADIIARHANGMANDLATTTLLATNKPVIFVPAMNPYMWQNAAVQANIETLKSRDIEIIEPAHGDMACGETGQGRMVEPEDILNSILSFLQVHEPIKLAQKDNVMRLNDGLLAGHHAIVTSGPTYEPIDPVRFIGNRSSGKQGHAIARALRDAGATVTLVTGPTALPDPENIKTIHIETANEMMEACENTLPASIAVCAAAPADYGVEAHAQKQKKSNGGLDIKFKDNPDILATLSSHSNRPDVVIGFAAETENLMENARVKLDKKQCDAIVANQVGQNGNPVFGSDKSSIYWVTKNGEECYSDLLKDDIAFIIVEKAIALLNAKITNIKAA